MLVINQDLQSLLLICLEKHRPDLSWVVTNRGIESVDEELGAELRDAVGSELMEKGFNQYGEPNEYGLRLESLIDAIGSLMWN